MVLLGKSIVRFLDLSCRGALVYSEGFVGILLLEFVGRMELLEEY